MVRDLPDVVCVSEKGMPIVIRATPQAALNVVDVMDMVRSKNNVLSAKVMGK
jgi:hypothetical protein